MTAYRIELSDRQRARTITASDAKEAIEAAFGSRFHSARHDSDSVRQDGSVQYSRYQVNVQTGPTKSGATPVGIAWATVYRA